MRIWVVLIRSSIGIPVLLLFSLLPVFEGCGAGGGPDAGCRGCHRGLEETSPSHGDCVSCHGGDPRKKEKEASHRGMFGPKNPSEPQWWDRTCGKCHPYQLGRVKSNLMQTNTGMVRNIQATWEGSDGRLYGTRAEETFDSDGLPLRLEGVAGLPDLSGELYRKFCSLCHIGLESNEVWSGSHAGGCAACHFPYNDNATYEGGDPTVREKWPYSATHRLASLPDNRVCLRCHNRSGRIALSYQGMNDGNNGLVPTAHGQPGPRMIGGARNATSITPDIHHEKGMECIDCHTSRDVMGDGYAYGNMYLQTEIRCEDCHGSASESPRHAPVTRENEEPVRESRSYRRQVAMGDELVLTGKGRKYSNVFFSGGKVIVIDKRYGRRHESKVITGTPEHTIAGHGRMECSACHSLSVPQCYGCHTRYDLGKKGRDFIRGADTPGAFSEAEDYRMLSPFPLAINQRGKISPVTPGCQTFVTVAAPGGKLIKDEYVARYKGKNQLRFAPFTSHNTGRAAIGCSECHADPAFLGFGQNVVQGNRVDALLLCEKSREKPLDGFLTMKQGKIRAFSAITRENSRPLNAEEIRRVWAVNQCLVCHRNPKDAIYREKIDYRILARCLSRPLPSGR